MLLDLCTLGGVDCHAEEEDPEECEEDVGGRRSSGYRGYSGRRWQVRLELLQL